MGLIDTLTSWATRGAGAIRDAAVTTYRTARTLGRDMNEVITGRNSKPVWPPESELPRLRGYQVNKHLYEGEHHKVYGQKNGEACTRFKVDDARPYLMTNLCGRLSNLLAGRMFGEAYTVAAPADEWATQEFLHHLTQANALHDLAARLGVEDSWRGAIAAKVTYLGGDEQRIEISDVDPARVFVERDPLNMRRIVAANIDQVLRPGKQAYLWRERHELRDGEAWVVNKLFALEGDEGDWHLDEAEDEVALTVVPALADKLPEVATGIDDLLLVYIDGHGDYTDALKSIQGEYNNRLQQRMAVLDKHVDPTRYGPAPPESAIGADGRLDLDKIRYIEVDKESVPNVGVITWDGQLGPSENELRELKVDFATTAGVDATAMFPSEGQAVSSGKALRLQQMTTQDTVLLRQPRYRNFLRRIYSICTKLATATEPGGLMHPLAWQPVPPEQQEGQPAPEVGNQEIVPLRVEDITITFGDGLPQDRDMDVQEVVDRYVAGLISLEAALARLDGLDDEEAKQAADEIRSEKQASMAKNPPAGEVLASRIAPVALG